jgi:hypothetical protein
VDLRPHNVDQLLDTPITHVDDFVMSICNLLVELNKLQSLAFNHVLLAIPINKDIRELFILEL